MVSTDNHTKMMFHKVGAIFLPFSRPGPGSRMGVEDP